MSPPDLPTIALLRSLDDPDAWEFPSDYVHEVCRERFHALASSLGPAFGNNPALVNQPALVHRLALDVQTDVQVQDASFYGDIQVPAEVTASRVPLIVRVSNFGGLVTIGAGGLARDSVAAVDGLHEADRARIDAVATRLGCTLVPGHVLRRPYDGPTPLDDGQRMWWHRFFDYM